MTAERAKPNVDPLNGGMHASIFVRVWGDAGGGDIGRIALAEYAYDLGQKSKQAEVDSLRAELEMMKVALADANTKLAAQVKTDVKAIHSAVLAIKPDPSESKERQFMFLTGVHGAAAAVSQFGFPPAIVDSKEIADAQ